MAEAAKIPVGQVLVQRGVISPTQLDRALQAQKPFSLPLASTILKLGLADEPTLIAALAEHFGVSGVDLGASVISTAQLSVLPLPVARSHGVLALAKEGQHLHCAVTDPSCQPVLDEIGFASGLKVVPLVCLKTRITRTIDAAYKLKKGGRSKWLGERRESDDEFLALINPASMSKSVSIDVEIPNETLATSRDAQALPQRDRNLPPRVLLVDGNDDVLDLVTLALDQHGIETVVGNRGGNVIELIEQYRPDVILLDAMLTEVPGFDLCARLKQSPRYKHLPVLIVSSMAAGWNLGQDVRRLFNADGFMAKPFQVAALVRWVEDALHESAGRERNQELAQAAKISAHESRRAIGHYESGALDEALEAARRAVRADPLDARAHFVLGTVLNAVGETYQAISQYERAADLAPSAFYPLKNLAIVYERQGFTAKAIEMWVRALGHCPNDAVRQTIKAHLVGLL